MKSLLPDGSFDAPQDPSPFVPPLIGQPKVEDVVFVPLDLVEERELRDGPDSPATWFFVADGKTWGHLSGVVTDVLGATVLRDLDGQGVRWVGVPGARVVLRLQLDGFVGLDLMTRGDGATVTLPKTTCMVRAQSAFRVEVTAPGYEGRTVRVALHCVRGKQA